MRLKKISFILLIIGTFSFFQVSPLLAQNEQWKQYDLNYRTFRITLIPGISTNGLEAPHYAAKYSFNILAGYNGAFDGGFEFGTLVNANKYYASGVQIAGLANYSGEETAGVQFAGIANISGDRMQGIQMAGAANISRQDMQGLQFAGAVNFTAANSQGLQLAGALNYAKNGMQGLYWAGVGNYTSGNAQGLLFSGAFNIARDIQGIIASGMLNYSENLQGIAIAPLNINKNFQGLQIGTVNIAQTGEGIQLGVINYADEFEGLPVGLISYYNNGRKNIDLWISDGGFTNLGVKLGTNEVYNMISIGYNTLLDRDVWQIGWSIGRLREYENHFMYSDFSYFKINEGGWTSEVNSIFKYRLLFGKELFSNLKLYGGPTFNLMVSSLAESDDYTWYRLIDYEAYDNQYVFWIGFTFGTELF